MATNDWIDKAISEIVDTYPHSPCRLDQIEATREIVQRHIAGPLGPWVTIDFDYTQMVLEQPRTYRGNVVGRDTNDRNQPFGYGPNTPRGVFRLDELPRVWNVLSEQLATDQIVLHIHPYED